MNDWKQFCDWCNSVRTQKACEVCGRDTYIICVGCGDRTNKPHECRTVSIPPSFPVQGLQGARQSVCPYCQKPGIERRGTSKYRRGDRVVQVDTIAWECPSNCPGVDTPPPFSWRTANQLRINDEAARAAWKGKFGEEMPPSELHKAVKDLSEEAWKAAVGKEIENLLPVKPPAPSCAKEQKRHCFHKTNLTHPTEPVKNGYHECLRCCWCGWTFCRSTTNARIPEGHGPFIMDTKAEEKGADEV